ncbi:hypothetical protein K227x_26540 [Rubripirellula lacrimiformis]|uniref:Nickel uptake substrate-specific transmembrane region n=1 Tax=Rubripirellula lacrimiformis TaxID=1930273 RepID=A0A517NAV5_9BACT|nr:thioredoxin family protein [Rubripirellula lacrimiformis]QDT04264.1 hypothetical protein K227x_26540 [Rubripirellula lacrimiformis]
MLIRRLVAIVVVAGVYLSGTGSVLHAETPAKDWIRGTLDQLQVCLRGEVFLPDGQPAQDMVLGGGINSVLASQSLNAVVDGNCFEMWIPVNQQRWHSMWLRVASKDGALVGYQRVRMHQIRQAAIDGIKMTLQRPTRELKVRVTHQGQVIPAAAVKVDLGFGIELHERTGADGIAVFRLLSTQKPYRMTVWTDDYRVGGFSFNRKPTRDPSADQHDVELSQCRDQTLRLVDQDGAPVPDIPFVLQMAKMPYNNYIGTNENSQLTTDKNGEVHYQWFPDWDRHHFYPELQTSNWVRDGEVEMVGGVAVWKLRKGTVRKRIIGRTVLQGSSENKGFFVTLRSFQGEQENHSDLLTVFADTKGEFALDVLPNATYCAWTLDSQWVGELSHLIPYQSESDQVTAPKLVVKRGQMVKVIARSGETERPYADLAIGFQREHRYTWQEDGEERSGVGGPQWFEPTNAEGVATTFTLPGVLRTRVSTPLWRTATEVEVAESTDPTVIRLHREVDKKRTVTGKLVLSEAVRSSLEGAEIKIGSIDGENADEQAFVVNQDGAFSFETRSTKIGIFASTRDGKAAVAEVIEKFDSPIELRLQPTVDYHGQLLGDADQPLAWHKVWASVQIVGEVDFTRRNFFSTRFYVKQIETMTDSFGNYTLANLPSEVTIGLRTDAIDGSAATRYLDDLYLERGETRPLAVSHLGKKSGSAKAPLGRRYAATLRDCSLMGFRMMLITSAGDKPSTEFIGKNLMNYRNNQDVTSFMQLVVEGSPHDLPPSDIVFLKEQDFPLPDAGSVMAFAIDSRGNELGRLALDVAEDGAAEKAADFVHRHLPDQVDAETKWDEAFDEAKTSRRKVWARISQRYCGPCFRMARWLDDNQDLLAKDYVMLKIDNVRDKNGVSVADRLTRGGQHGVPFHAIFDVDQDLLVDSEGPLGNIGHPSGFEGKKYLRTMLMQTRQRLADAEVDIIVASLSD